MAMSESLARGGVMMVMLNDNLDNVFLLSGVRVFVRVARIAGVSLSGLF